MGYRTHFWQISSWGTCFSRVQIAVWMCNVRRKLLVKLWLPLSLCPEMHFFAQSSGDLDEIRPVFKAIAQHLVSYEKQHFMQFSVAAHESCTLHCVLLDCNGTKWTGNALSIPAATCSQQLLRRNKLPTGCYFFSFWSFQAMIWMCLWQILL